MAHCNCNGIRLYYEELGSGQPLVLINGLGSDMRITAPLADELARSCTVVSFDMRGAGQSDKPQEEFSIADIAQDSLELIEQLCGGSAHIMGYSMGGCVAMELALRNPQAVKTLSLVATFPSWTRPHPPSDELKALFERTDVSEELIAEVYDIIFGPAFKERLPKSTFVQFRLNDPMPQPAYSYLNQLNALKAFDVYDEVTALSAPTLVVAGDADHVVPPDNSRWLNETIAGSKLCILEDVGHVVPLEAPKELASHIASHAKG